MAKTITSIGYQNRLANAEQLAKQFQNDPELFQAAIDAGYLPGVTSSTPPAGVSDEVLVTKPGRIYPNGGTTDWWAESAPFLEDFGITRGQAAWGAGGITAAGLGLAAMLANSGQPQIDPAAYAAYQQSANSY